MRIKSLLLMFAGLACAISFFAQSPPAAQSAQSPQSDVGVPVTDEATKTACGACHKSDDKGRMTRISYLRTTPEGWQEILKRMVRNNGLTIDPVQARNIVKYLSNNHGLTPSEAR